jgi:hypothetical protein
MLNSHDIAILGMLASTVLFSTNIVFVALWIRARERALRATLDSPRVLKDPQSLEVEHLVHAVDAIALEVERISEAQRFTTQVLVGRAENGSFAKRAPIPERVITPH